MRYQLLLIPILVCCAGSKARAQYTYFNNVYLDVPESNILVTGIFSNADGYVNFGQSVIDNGYNLQFRILNDTGEIEQDILVPFPDTAFYLMGQNAFQEYADGYAWTGALVSTNDDNTGIAIWFDPATYQPQWIHIFDDLVNEQATSPMSCLRKMNDGSFYIGGNIWHYLDDNVSVDEFSTYIAHLNEQGEIIDQWFFNEGNENFEIQQIFQLDNGKLLLSGMRYINEIKDAFMMLFNPATGLIELENVWGSEWNESTLAVRKMPDGQVYGCYDVVLESNGEIMYPTEMKQCRLRKINTDNLSYEWDIEIPLEDLSQETRGFGVAGFEPTLDDGYVLLYYYAPEDFSEGYYQPHIVKMNSDFELEWTKSYEIPTEAQISWGIDLDVAPDGGFLCTGFALVPDPGEFQRQWTFKTDACGDLEDLGCPTSVSDLAIENLTLKISPNPANNVVSILTRQPFELITIRDLTGRMVYNQNHNNRLFAQINLEHLAKGAYLVDINFANGVVETSKLIVE